MARWEFDKAALGHILDSVRLGLDALRDETIGRTGVGAGHARHGAQTYAHLRRLRTYLQRFVSSHETAELDLGEDDQNVLAACGLHEVGRLDRAIADSGRRDGSELARLEARRTALATWCVRLATRRIESLTATSGRQGTATIQTIHREVQHRLMSNPDGDGLALIHDLTTDPRGAPSLASQAPFAPQASVAAPPPPLVARQPGQFGGGVAPTRADPVAAARLHAGVSPDAPRVHVTPPPPIAMRPVGLLSFDARHLQDPRLRAMLQLDIAAYGRAIEAQDHRLGMAHLASIIEAAIIDVGLAQRQRFTLGGSPEAWNLEAIITRLLEHHFTPVNHEALRFLGLARHILRPAQQLSAAVTVTPAMRLEFEEFAYRILTAVAASGEAR